MMKNLLPVTAPLSMLLFVFMLSDPISGHAQSYIHQGNITLSNQIQVNNFANAYSDITIIEGNLLIGDHAQSTNIDDLTPLTKLLIVRGVLTVVNTDITTLQGLHKLLEANYFVIANNEKLTSLMSVSQLEKVYGSLQIDGNHSLSNLEGLEQIVSVGDSLNGYLQIFNNDGLKSLEGLNALQVVGNNLQLGHNDSLKSISALSSLKGIGESLVIRTNPALTTLQGLENLEFLGRSLFVESNHGLTDLEHLGSLDTLYSLKVKDNEGLNTLNGLQDVVYIENSLEIIGNDALYSLTGLENLVTINGSLEINDNPKLENLVGFDGLTTVKSDFSIINNQKLSSFNGLPTNFTAGGVEIMNNPLLFSCSQGFVCEAIRNEKYVYILDNASGCESTQQVENACGSSGINDDPGPDSFATTSLSMNGVLKIRFAERWDGRLSVIDAAGRTLLSRQLKDADNFQIRLQHNTNGILLLRFEGDEMRLVKKIMCTNSF